MSDEPSEHSERLQIPPEVWLDVCKYMMREYAAEHELTTDQIPGVHPRDFTNFCNLQNLPMRDCDELCEGIRGLTPPMVEYMTALLQGDVWDAAAQLGRVWPGVLLANKPPLRNQPMCFHLSVTCTFQDETVLQLAAQGQWNPIRPATDGFLLTVWQHQALTLLDMIGKQGLDALHDRYAQPLEQRLGGVIQKLDVSGGTDQSCPGSN